jgi:nucleotide-binding universal stress UspA family protein
MKIMVCYNGLDAAQRALDYARKRAKENDAELWVVYSLQAENGTAHLYGDEIEQAKESLKAASASLAQEGIAHQTHLLQRGLTAGEDLVLFAGENDMDEVVLGIRNRSRVGKLLLGSVAQYVILQGPCPVVSV